MVLLIQTVLLAAISTGGVFFLNKRLFTPIAFYWVGWIVGIASAELASNAGTLVPIDSLGADLILRAHIGAVVGSVAGALGCAIPLRGNFLSTPSIRENARPPMPPWGLPLLAIQFSMGIYLVLRRLTEVGSVFNLYDVRQSYLEEAYLQASLPFAIRFYSFLSLGAAMLPFLLGKHDATNSKFSGRFLALVYVAAAPGGISSGGRVWLASSIVVYLLSYVLHTELRRDYRALVKGCRYLALPLATLVGCFITFATIRDAVFSQQESTLGGPSLLKPAAPLLYYLGITVAAVGPYSEFASTWDESLGRVSFPWVEAQMYKVGVVDEMTYLSFVKDSRLFVTLNRDWDLGSTHASLIPPFVADFGVDNISLAVFLFCFAVHIAFMALPDKGDTAMMTKVMLCLYGGAFCFQDSLLGTANAIVPVISIWLFGFAGRTLSQKTWRWVR